MKDLLNHFGLKFTMLSDGPGDSALYITLFVHVSGKPIYYHYAYDAAEADRIDGTHVTNWESVGWFSP